MKAALGLILSFCLGAAAPALAQQAPATTAPSADDYVKALTAPDAQPPAKPSTSAAPPAGGDEECPTCEAEVDSLRGFSLATPGAAPKARPAGFPAPAVAQQRPSSRPAGQQLATAGAMAPQPGRPSKRDLLITFKLGSADLTDEGARNARSFATALKSPQLSGRSLVIVGHTDATGSPERNLILSQQRADSVKAFLVQEGIDAGRLQTKGVGSQELANPADPGGAANRRVEAKLAG